MIELGQKVTGGPRLRRRQDGKARKWAPYEWDKRKVEGIYIGYRHYQNGNVDWIPEEGGTWKLEGRPFKVALIVPNERSNPIPVLFDTMVAR